MTVRNLDAKALWWHDAEECACSEDDECEHYSTSGWEYLRLVPVGTTPYVTDGFVAFPAHLLNNAPSADDMTEVEADSRYSDFLTLYLAADGRPHPSNRWFTNEFLDIVETAGYRVRPLRAMANVHGICDPEDWRVVGVVNAISPTAIDVIGRVAL